MSNNKITPEQEKVIDTIYNFIWHRITHDDHYLESIPDIESRDLHVWIYYMKYEFIEYDDSLIQAIVYLNGKHYEYNQTPQLTSYGIWVNEIDVSLVKDKIIALNGEIYYGFEIYDPDLPIDDDVKRILDGLVE